MSTERKPLWPKPIPIIGGTGVFASGKSLFGLSIDPGPRTLVYDLEKSTAAYTDIGFDRIDVLDAMREKFPAGYKPLDLFLWWRDHIKKVEPNKYTVIVVDPVTDLERGLTDWVFANPQHFGHTKNQYDRMSGIAWGDVKDYYKAMLGDLSTRCETFYYTAHVGREFVGNEATKNLKVKGKSTLSELASLFLWFERKPDAKGVLPDKPSALVQKSRLVSSTMVKSELITHAVLPARIPEATPAAIRKYFTAPAGGRAAAEGEQAPEEKLSEDEKLLLRTRIAEAERDAALAKASNGTTTPTPPAKSDAFNRCALMIDQSMTLDALDQAGAEITKAKDANLFIDFEVPTLRSRWGARREAILQPKA